VEKNFNKASQFLLPTFTILGFFLVSIKKPEIGLPIQLIAQIFWLYTGYTAWKKAGQIGIFISSLALTVIVLFGVINYWFF
jgi:riboflavin transporter FmnP